MTTNCIVAPRYSIRGRAGRCCGGSVDCGPRSSGDVELRTQKPALVVRTAPAPFATCVTDYAARSRPFGGDDAPLTVAFKASVFGQWRMTNAFGY